MLPRLDTMEATLESGPMRDTDSSQTLANREPAKVPVSVPSSSESANASCIYTCKTTGSSTAARRQHEKEYMVLLEQPLKSNPQNLALQASIALR